MVHPREFGDPSRISPSQMKGDGPFLWRPEREGPPNHRISDSLFLLTLSMGTIEVAIIGLDGKRSKS